MVVMYTMDCNGTAWDFLQRVICLEYYAELWIGCEVFLLCLDMLVMGWTQACLGTMAWGKWPEVALLGLLQVRPMVAWNVILGLLYLWVENIVDVCSWIVVWNWMYGANVIWFNVFVFECGNFWKFWMKMVEYMNLI